MDKGYQYEIFIHNYLVTQPNNKNVYLWKHIPERILLKLNLIINYDKYINNRIDEIHNPLHDIGIDILVEKENDEIVFVQCKNHKSNITIHDLSGFFMMLLRHNDINGELYYTSDLSHYLTKYKPKNVTYIQKIFENNDVKKQFKLYDYQNEIITNYTNYFENNNLATLSSPCGTGKTLMSYYISQKYEFVVLLTPLRQYCEQAKIKYDSYGRKCLIVDSEHIRCPKTIYDKKCNNFDMICCTYKSCNILTNFLNKYKLCNIFVIIDEFHNLSKKNVLDKNDPIYQLIHMNHKYLFMSATPKIYELNDEKINLGENLCNLNIKNAIENKYICDYEIYCPEIDKDKTDVNNKCETIFSFIRDFGKFKMIAYFQSHDEINYFKLEFDKLNILYNYNITVNVITSDTKKLNRTKILNNFSNNDGSNLILSVRILDECIDLPICDSIYMTYSSMVSIRNVQRLCRCLRLCEGKSKGRVILYDSPSIFINHVGNIDKTFNVIKLNLQMNNVKIKKIIDSSVKIGINNSNVKNIECIKQDIKLIQNNFSQIIHKNINDDYGYSYYCGFEVIIMKKNGYINATKLSQKENKRFGDWLANESSKKLIKIMSENFNLSKPDKLIEPVIIIKGSKKNYEMTRGAYVHKNLMIHIASWISSEFAMTVSKFM